ncbi:hypothetical protein CQ010_16515 [Arthrobacter sp. MYb211]|nr:hypothetical protein CQ015_16500 [Arthrobacter sp. MYb221]PRC04862.1 hypothetical protein CQ010_16515 [Arthrobacter sp. MYb211]
MSDTPTRWRRFKKHPAVKTGLAVGGAAAVGALALLAWRSQEGIKQASSALIENVPEFTATFESIGKEVPKQSPTEHAVKAHSRLQHYGPGRTEVKMVPILSYTRGGNA